LEELEEEEEEEEEEKGIENWCARAPQPMLKLLSIIIRRSLDQCFLQSPE
jgi:hypothetical protein